TDAITPFPYTTLFRSQVLEVLSKLAIRQRLRWRPHRRPFQVDDICLKTDDNPTLPVRPACSQGQTGDNCQEQQQPQSLHAGPPYLIYSSSEAQLALQIRPRLRLPSNSTASLF